MSANKKFEIAVKKYILANERINDEMQRDAILDIIDAVEEDATIGLEIPLNNENFLSNPVVKELLFEVEKANFLGKKKKELLLQRYEREVEEYDLKHRK